MATRPNFESKIAFTVPRPEPRTHHGLLRTPGDTALIQKSALFANLNPAECTTILAAGHERNFPRGETIYMEGDTLKQVAILRTGSAKMVRCGEDGSAVILRLCGPGELVSTVAASMQGQYRCTSQAVTSCSALVWDSTTFESLSHRHPSLRLNVAYILYKQLEDMENRFREISTERVASRLGRQILRLVVQVGIRNNGAVEISITREELAQLIGTSLYTVSRLLSEWDRRGIVATRREGFSVQNVQALADLTG